MVDQNINVNITATIESLTAGIRAATEQIEKITAPLGAVKKAFEALQEAMVAAFAVREVGEFVDKLVEFQERMTELGAQTDHLSQQLGLSTEAIGGFTNAAGAMGLSSEQAAHAIERLERNMAEASRGAGQAASTFRALGIDVTNAVGDLKPLDEILPEIAEKFAAAANGPEKTAAAIALLGRAGADMIPFLNRGRDGLAEFNRIARETGTALSDQVAKGFEDSKIISYELGESYKGLSLVVAEKLKPAFDALYGAMTRSNEAITRWLKGDDLTQQIVKMNKQLVDAEDRLEHLKSSIFSKAFVAGQEAEVERIRTELNALIAKAQAEANKYDEEHAKPKLPAVPPKSLPKEAANIAGDREQEDAKTKAALDGQLARIALAREEASTKFRLGQTSSAEETASLVKAENDKTAAITTAAKATFEAKTKAIDAELALNKKLDQTPELEAKTIKLEADKLAIKTAFDGEAAAEASKHQAELVRIGAAGSAEIAEERKKGYDNEIREADTAAKQTTARLKQEFAEGKITLTEETQSRLEAEQQRFTTTQAAYAKIDGLSGLSQKVHQDNLAKEVADVRANEATKLAIVADSEIKIAAEAQKAAQDKIRIVEESGRQEESITRLKVASGILSEKEGTRELIAEAEARLTKIRAAFDEELRLANLSLADRQRIEREKTAAVAQAEQQIIGLRTQEVSQQRELSNSITSDFTSALTSMLTTQETWNQRMINLLNSLVGTLGGVFDRMAQDFIYRTIFPQQWAAEQSALHQLAITQASQVQQTGVAVTQSGIRTATQVEAGTLVGDVDIAGLATHETVETTKTGATVVGSETRLAAEESASGAGLFAEIGSAIKSITISAYKAAAAVYASVAEIPFVGWILAPALAAGALATVLHFAGAFEEGAWEVPQTGMAQIHKGEMVIPAQQAATIRSASSARSSSSSTATSASPKQVRANDFTSLVSAVRQTATKFETGAWDVPSTQVAQVHQGEMVVPESQAAQLRDAKTVRTNDFTSLAQTIQQTTSSDSLKTLMQTASIKAYETGTDSVQQTGLAQVHQGEMIIPAGIATTLRESPLGQMGLSKVGTDLVRGGSLVDVAKIKAQIGEAPDAGSGGDTSGSSSAAGSVTNVHFTVNATDASSVTALFKRNGRALADIVAGQIRSAPTSMTKTIKGIAGPAF